MHVQVTPDLHRNYEKKINILLDQYEKRIDWLSKGSRELFGTVIENNICILIDTSQSMQLSLDFVKRKLATLIQVIENYEIHHIHHLKREFIGYKDMLLNIETLFCLLYKSISLCQVKHLTKEHVL